MERRLHDFIPYLRDLYTINDKGEVFSDNTGKMKTRNKGNTEYQIINFMKEDGKKKTFRLHRLVMMAFEPIENCESMEVNHKDGNKKNNCLSNLEWCSSSENQKHAFRTGLQKPRRGEANNLSKLTEKDVIKVLDMHDEGFFDEEIAEEVGCSVKNIYSILSGKSWKHITAQRLSQSGVESSDSK